MSRYEKIPLTKLFGTLLLERIFDLLCYFLFIIITILIQVETVSDFISEPTRFLIKSAPCLFGWLSIILICGALLVLIARWTLIRHKNHRYVVKLRGLQVGLKEGFSTILHLKKRTAFIGHTLFIWATYLFEIYIGFSALSATSSLGMGAAFSVLSLVTLAMIVSPGGLGAFPVAVQQVLAIYSVNNISFGWLMWGVTTTIVLSVGALSFGLLIYQNKNKNEEDRFNPGKNI